MQESEAPLWALPGALRDTGQKRDTRLDLYAVSGPESYSDKRTQIEHRINGAQTKRNRFTMTVLCFDWIKLEVGIDSRIYLKELETCL